MTDHAEVTIKIPVEALERGPLTFTITHQPAEPEPEPLPANSPPAESEPA